MRKNTLISGLFLISSHLFSQNATADKLKQENQKLKTQISKLQNETTALKQDTTFLRKEISFCTLYNQSSKTETSTTNNSFKFSFISCKGNRAAQNVTVTFTIEHNLPNQDFSINEWSTDMGDAYDAQGTNYRITSMNATSVGGMVGSTGKIPTGIPITITLTFDNVLPGNDFFKLVSMIYNCSNLDKSNKQAGTVNFKNIKIMWN
jgi:hypothetical protein